MTTEATPSVRRPVQLALALALVALLALPWLAMPVPIAACSCAEFPGFAAVADPEHIVVAGRVVARRGDRTAIQVDRWLWGPGGRSLLEVREASPETDMCALGPVAPIGAPWLWVAWAPPNELPSVNACLPSWSLADPEGTAQLDQALAAFGSGTPLGSRTPLATSPPTPDDGGRGDPLVASAAALALAAGVAVLGGAAVVARRRKGADGQS